MSSIPTKQIDGDVAIGRNVTAGGNAIIQGNTTVKKNLKVEGWLDAVNIKGPNKGIFNDVTKLREAYPLPHDGWWALVGNTLPAPLYIASGGAWVATGESAGNPTIDSQQYNDAVAVLESDLNSLSSDVSANSQSIDQIRTQINTIGGSVNTLTTDVSDLKTRMGNAETSISTAETNVAALQTAVSDLQMLTSNLSNLGYTYVPSLVSNYNGKDVLAESFNGKSVFDLLATKGDVVLPSTDGTKTTVTCGDTVMVVVWRSNHWEWYDTNIATKTYTDEQVSAATTTATSGDNSLRTSINSLNTELAPRKFFNVKALLGQTGMSATYTLDTALALLDADNSQAVYGIDLGSVITFPTTEGWEMWQYVANGFSNTDNWKKTGGSSAVGNCYNVTAEQPISGYYDLETAVSAMYAKGLAGVGVQITFAIARGSWKTYQYVGNDNTETNFKDITNWIDLAGMSAGSEPMLNVTALCGACSNTDTGYYTLAYAIAAIQAKQAETGITYAKSGMVITYQTGERTFETKQFIGAVSDFGEQTLWNDFGGGGVEITTSATPAKDGTDAFSTGGAYEMLHNNVAVGLEMAQVDTGVSVYAVNGAGQQIGEAVTIERGGSGTASGSSLNIYLEDAAPYAAFGSTISVRAAIKSVSYDGDTEVLGVIRTLAIVDASTGLTLWSETVNTNSSASSTDYKFTLNFTDYFSEAASKDFQIVATDADGNVKRRTITVTAVDVTCTCVNNLNYTSGGSLEVNGSAKNISMYKFANNVSKQGVTVKTEMYYNGSWRVLGTATIQDTYTHSININPKDVFGGGEALTHGSYPIRIQGTDVASGVVGNTVYTAVMCIDSTATTPVVSLRFDDKNNGTIRLYDTMTLQVAAYTPGKTTTAVDVYLDGAKISALTCQSGSVYSVSKQIQGYASDGTKELTAYAQSGTAQSGSVSVRVSGSAIGAELKEGALFGYDFATRSNDESDHSISDNGYAMEVVGANWSSNGFKAYLGENALRIAENVKATIPYAPFGTAATERTNGMAFQFAFATNNIKDAEAKLMECYDADSGAGFYICGNKAVLYCKNGTPQSATRSFRSGEKITVGIVVEPSTKTVSRGSTEYSTIKMYLNGEEVAAIGYVANSGAILNTKQITFDGTDGDLYLYYVLAYDSYYEWVQAFSNYLCKLTDTDAMIEEYEAEDVLSSNNTPSLDALKERGIPYYVVVAPQATFDSFDSDINTSTNFLCTLYYFHPTMPWRSFKAENVRWRRQGTTSAKRPVKNDRFYLQKEKNWKITALNPDYTSADALKTYELFNIGYVRVGENTIPVKIITVKVDYSDSSNANDCGVCDMMNATFRAMGSSYMTPAQRAFDGTWKKGDVVVSGLEMNHSTANHPIAAFRATLDSLTDAWFHAKGNWKEDKGEQVALGFQDTPGYNKGCLNYGDFIEFFGTEGESLDDTMARFKTTEGLDTTMPYLLSQYCGRDYRIMRYSGGEWARSSGTMQQVDGKWTITGDVLNPVSGYELLTYDAFNWWQGVGSVSDMMAATTTESSWVTKLNLGQTSYPAWTRYFECMIDDDQLQIDLAMGRKVPYDLYLVMKFCDSVDYSKESLAATWKDLWKTDAWKYMSVQSLMSYYTFTDYLAAVDQQAKNMQPMFFLEDGCSVVDGVYSSPNAMQPVRMYFNKVYDCDTCNGKDNDGGNTIPSELDPATDTQCYAGRGSVLWNDLRGQQEMIIDASGNTLTLTGVVAAMRNLPEVDGIGAGPFSPKGANYYFVDKRMKTWPKKVSSYDGERKYINYTGYNDIYFYALQGLGLTSLPAFIEQRWRIRDGYYQTGDFKDASHILGGRIGAKSGAVIKFKAAKSGYFGIGNDSGNVTQGMYLQAGESGTFTEFQHGDNILLYIYQADRMSEIDLSQLSLDPNFQFSVMKLAQKITIGSADHGDWTLSPGNTGFLTNLQLGDLPFLRELDVRNTEIQTINASQCPRLEKMLGEGSAMTTLSLAETSPVNTVTLPGTMTDLTLVNLPSLAYPASNGVGLTIASLANVQRLMLDGCPQVDAYTLLLGVTGTGNTLKYLRLPNVNITAPSSILASLKSSGAIGLDPTGTAYEESGQCSGITGRWIMSDLIEDATLSEYVAYFPQLTLYNAQYSTICFDDTAEDTANISNLDNQTGYAYGNTYVPSGHFLLVEKNSHVYKCTYNSQQGKMHLEQISDTDYTKMADGTEFDVSDVSGIGFDVMKVVAHHWYKGVNDYKNQKKYLLLKYGDEEPLSTATKVTRKTLSEIVVKTLSAVHTTDLVTGGDYVLSDNSNHNVYEIDVEGMVQVRWPGVNNATIGAVFLDANRKVVGTFNMAVTHSLFDFVSGEYVFTDVPKGAKTLLFTAPSGCDDLEAIAVDSAAIEAIEPDWVFNANVNNLNEQNLVGVYGASLDTLNRMRSISGAVTKRGDGTNAINSDWAYDSEGELTNATVPTSEMHYSGADLINLCRMRGRGFYSIDYEQSKEIANIVFGLIGDRDVQAVCGYGCGTGYTTGSNSLNTYGNITRKYSGSNIGNLIFGLQNFVACNYEWMDNVAINVESVKALRRAKYAENAAFPIDAKWHIYNPFTGSEREVQGITNSGYCVARVKFGRYADIIASRVSSDNSQWNKHYSDVQYFTNSRSRVPLRSGNNALAFGGLVCANANYAGAHSNTGSGVRLAFKGECVYE